MTAAAVSLAWALLRRRRLVLFTAVVGHAAVSALLLPGGGTPAMEGVLSSLATVSTIVVLACLHGVVALDLRSGRGLLWLQKPVSPTRHYLLRWAAAAAVAMGVVVALAVPTGWLLHWTGAAPGARILGSLAVILLLALLLAGLVFGVSGWGARADGLVATGILVLSVPMSLLEERLGALRGPLAALAVPMDDLDLIGELVAEGVAAAEILPPLGNALGTLALWVALGVVGTWATTRSPLPREAAG